METRRRASPVVAASVTVVALVTMALGYLNKARCAGPPFDDAGRSEVFDRIKDSAVCYSDIQFLWLGRGIDLHLFPYVGGAIAPDGSLTGGTVEYPVLSGMLMWLGGLASDTDADFLAWSAVLLAPFGALIAWMLGRLAGRVALIWSASPALVMYAFHNWELPVVATAVGAVAVMATRLPLRVRAVIAAVLLGIGFCLKLYPGAFVLPLAAYVLHGETERDRRDVRGALGVLAAAGITVAAINVPFAVAGYDGWRASFAFQSLRQADITTNSIWYWGVRYLFETPGATPEVSAADEAAFQSAVDLLSPTLVLLSFAGALWVGRRRLATVGSYPWVQTSAVMLTGFLLFHKVHSPQYTLWILPFFVLLRVPWQVVGAYLLTDVAVGVGVFRWFAALAAGQDARSEETLVVLGVWGRTVLLVILLVLFARADVRTPPVRSTRPRMHRLESEEVPV
ncbi:glycosyltransferase 87 family protein [Rhodococcoides kroppenstedtii]|uniref:glycosyltransferase 87 family protein n=1 Tax=Rhodococcoides kroppenstedtii TaxID=293050 RepID=UPI001BDE2880|nr:glycosyltransferase 87 family protein [Rhodococcus kroppenstedtii]MBT1190518.1 DUF2029 domain-containing protein [Rhodococcus kroppenstedtii]